MGRGVKKQSTGAASGKPKTVHLSGSLVNGKSRRVLEALADTLHIDLDVSVGGMVYGTSSKEWSATLLGLSLPIKMEIASDFTAENGEDIGLLVKGPGDLALLAYASDLDSRVRVYVINRLKLNATMSGIFEAEGVTGLASALKLLAEGLVAGYVRDFNENHWTKMVIKSAA